MLIDWFIYWRNRNRNNSIRTLQHYQLKSAFMLMRTKVCRETTLAHPRHENRLMKSRLPIFIALYTLLVEKMPPRPNSNSLESAGTSWLLVTRILTHDGLQTHSIYSKRSHHFVKLYMLLRVELWTVCDYEVPQHDNFFRYLHFTFTSFFVYIRIK